MEQIGIKNIINPGEISEDDVISKITQRIKELFKKSPKEVKEIEVKIREKDLEDFKEEGFDIVEKLKQVDGPFVEVAGPTDGGYKLVNMQNLGKKVFTSNLWVNGKIDFQASATELPIKDGKVGALFVSCIGGIQKNDPEELKKLNKKMTSWRVTNKDEKRYEELAYESKRKLRDTTLQEALRVLEEGGVLIWQGGEKEDYDTASEMGLSVKELKKRTGSGYRTPSYNFILEKENLKKENIGA
jgi:hypothetical protein